MRLFSQLAARFWAAWFRRIDPRIEEARTDTDRIEIQRAALDRVIDSLLSVDLLKKRRTHP